MPIRADNDPRFSRRFLIMGVVAIGFAFWSLYDGMVKYPAARVRGFDEFKVEYKSIFENPRIKAMGVDALNSIDFYGVAQNGNLGQNNNSNQPWPMTGANDFTVPALPHDKVVEILKSHGRLVTPPQP